MGARQVHGTHRGHLLGIEMSIATAMATLVSGNSRVEAVRGTPDSQASYEVESELDSE